MDPIPIWVRRPWDAWGLRVLVLISFALQVVLSIFGSRRKNISSFWINAALVWSAYLMADWVAIVALSKLSDAEGDQGNNNELWFIWAPLVLLHLGGSDRITAYSLQDNQLWMRHLMGLVVQMFVAIYVIMMSWKNSWFSFMSFPAFIAGVAKYGERTWVLKSVSDDKYMHTLPVDNLGNNHSTGGCEYVGVLVLAHKHLEALIRLFHVPGRNFEYLRPHIDINEGRYMCDAVDVKMGLMYDLLYTKATNVYSMGGCILRFISIGCMVTVLVGLSIRIAHFNLREEDDLIDIAITGVLLVGALLLEIYAAIVMFSSNWMMLWLIKHGRRDWVKWLSDRFPWLFNKKKNWSQMMGQFDLIGYWLKDPAHVQSRSGEIIRWVLGEKYEDNWNKYRHKTACSVHDNWVYDTISEFLKTSSDNSCTDGEVRDQVEKIWKILDECKDFEAGFHEKIVCLHLATEIIYHLERETDASKDPSGSDSLSRNDLDGGEDPCKKEDPSRSSPQKNRKVSKNLSGYMMYILIMQPLLLPKEVLSFFSDTILDTPILDTPILISGDHMDVKSAACLNLLGKEGAWSRIYECLKGTPRRWEIMKLLWWRILQTAAGDIKKGGIGQKDGHFQLLTQGGELLTFIWFYNSPNLKIDTGRIKQKTLEV